MSEEERKKIVGKFRKQIMIERRDKMYEQLRTTGACGIDGVPDLEAEANKMADAYIKEMQEKEKS
jgi:hypothetical protein